MEIHSDIFKYEIPKYTCVDPIVQKIIDGFIIHDTYGYYEYSKDPNQCLYELIDNMAMHSLEVHCDTKPPDWLNACCGDTAPFVILGQLMLDSPELFYWFKQKHGFTRHRFIHYEISFWAMRYLNIDKIMWLIDELGTEFEFQGSSWMLDWYESELGYTRKEIDAGLLKVYTKLLQIGITKDELLSALNFQALTPTVVPKTHKLLQLRV